MIVRIRGTGFADIDRIIQTQIKPLDGILRIKECPIIQLYEM
jgi:hypothetical protein